MHTQDPTTPNFRDRLYTIDEQGNRLWVFAKKPIGKLTTARNIVGAILLLFFLTAPFIKVNGQPLLLFDFIHRIFVIFGVQFWPQDFHLFFIGMIALFVFIILFTATYGRIWCGWGCPQTIFMELIFRRIEYWIEGDHNQQKAMAAGPWTAGRILRTGLKQGIFYMISFIISNYFLMYIMGSQAWIQLVTDSPSNHIGGLAVMVIFSFVFFFVFSWFREQVCTIVCPYGRLQGVLLDSQSIVITYDHNRGEERAPLKKSENRGAEGKGDCIECRQCVLVCPTGVDIRNGTQLECINCACCIDACNQVMKRVGFKPGLIRYASEKMITGKLPWHFPLRSKAYTLLLIVLVAASAYFLTTRNPVEATVFRAPGMLFQEQEDGRLSNLYNVKVVNKTGTDLPLEVRLLSVKGEVRVIGSNLIVPKQSVGEGVFFIFLDRDKVTTEKLEVEMGIFSNGKLLDKTKATFIGPRK
jgi:cytochrome c oxidase accessory protein FixG